MKTCNDCLHCNVCKNNNAIYHTSRLTSESDVTERCQDFSDRSEWGHLSNIKNVIPCAACAYFSTA